MSSPLWQATPLALPQLFAAVASLFCVGVLWGRRQEAAGATELLVAQLCAAWWALMGVLEFCAIPLWLKMGMTQGTYFGVVLAPWMFLRFAISFTEQKPLSKWTEGAIGAGALLVLAAVFTNGWTGWLWPAVEPIEVHGWAFATYKRGPLFGIDFVYCYFLLAVALFYLLRYGLHSKGVFRRQVFFMVLTVGSPFITSLAYWFRVGPLPEIDHTPVGFALGGVFMAWNLFYWKLLDLVPVAAHTLFRQMSDPVLVMDGRHRLIKANPIAQTHFGLKIQDLGLPVETVLKDFPLIVEACLGKRHEPFQQDGVWWSVESTEFDGKSQTRGRLCVFRDITELVEAKEMANHMADEARRANHTKSDFLAHVSHDLRTPIHAVMALSEILVSEKEKGTKEYEYLSVIHEAGNSLLRLVDDLLDINRIEAGAVSLEDTPFELKPVIEAVVALLVPPARRKGLVLDFAIDPCLGMMRGDSTRLRQILVNLGGNAVKFSDEGRVFIEALQTEKGWLRLQVRDSGPGIPDEIQETLFEPFVRGRKSGKKEGSGLGLAIVRRLAEAMGGSVLAGNHPEGGALFTVDLPIIDTECAIKRGSEGEAGSPSP